MSEFALEVLLDGDAESTVIASSEHDIEISVPDVSFEGTTGADPQVVEVIYNGPGLTGREALMPDGPGRTIYTRATDPSSDPSVTLEVGDLWIPTNP